MIPSPQQQQALQSAAGASSLPTADAPSGTAHNSTTAAMSSPRFTFGDPASNTPGARPSAGFTSAAAPSFFGVSAVATSPMPPGTPPFGPLPTASTATPLFGAAAATTSPVTSGILPTSPAPAFSPRASVSATPNTPSAAHVSAPTYPVPEPFRDPDADLRVISSDEVEFRVYRAILKLSSPFFRDMFSLPRPSDAVVDEPMPWPEPAAVIDRLLHYIYPFVDPTIPDLDELLILIRAADKWQIDTALTSLRTQLVSSRFLFAYSFKVYGFACEMGFNQERDEAAGRAIANDPCAPPMRAYVKSLRAVDLLRLVHMRRYPGRSPDEFFKPRNGQPGNVGTAFTVPNQFNKLTADLVIESEEGIKFRVHKVILSEASPVFQKRIAALPGVFRFSPDDQTLVLPDPSELAREIISLERQTLLLPHPAKLICELLWYVYPVVKPKNRSRSLEDTMKLIEIAKALDIGIALSTLGEELVSPKNLQSHALRIFSFATQMQLTEERRIALREAIQTDPTEHPFKEDFQDMTAETLLVVVDTRKRILESALAKAELLGQLSMSGECRHIRKAVDALHGRGANLQAYVQKAMQKSLAPDVLFSADIAVKMFLSGSHQCQTCFQDATLLAQQRSAIKTFVLHVVNLVDSVCATA